MSIQHLPWSALSALTLALLGCSGGASHELSSIPSRPATETTLVINTVPPRALDLLFVIDNSPSMAAKQAKLKAEYSKMIRVFRDPVSGLLPNLRVAMITTDLGTGGAYLDGSCGPKTLPDGTRSVYGDLGRFQMVGAGSCGVTDPKALWLENIDGVPGNFEGDMGDVFACLAANLGSEGCEVKQPLRALEFALVAQGWGNEEQRRMLRPDAFLEIVIITDEDDCSATTDTMFGDKPELRGESTSLRCVTRGYACRGSNLSANDPGYPATQAFSAPLSECVARTDACPSSTDGLSNSGGSASAQCNPLVSAKQLAAEIKGLKKYPEDIVVAGIFGWPVSDASREGTAPAFRVAPVSNPDREDPFHPQLLDAWPVCYDRSRPPADPETYDAQAAELGAKAGLRISAFIDEFSSSGIKTSLCEDSLSDTLDYMDQICVYHAAPCIDDKLFDTNGGVDGVQADCRVVLRRPENDPANPGMIVYREDATSMPQCDPVLSIDEQPAYPCWRVVINRRKCAYNGQLLDVVPSPSERKRLLPAGTKIVAQCLTCTPEAPLDGVPGCDYPMPH